MFHKGAWSQAGLEASAQVRVERLNVNQVLSYFRNLGIVSAHHVGQDDPQEHHADSHEKCREESTLSGNRGHFAKANGGKRHLGWGGGTRTDVLVV